MSQLKNRLINIPTFKYNQHHDSFSHRISKSSHDDHSSCTSIHSPISEPFKVNILIVHNSNNDVLQNKLFDHITQMSSDCSYSTNNASILHHNDDISNNIISSTSNCKHSLNNTNTIFTSLDSFLD